MNKSSADVGKSFAANMAAKPQRSFSELQNNFDSFRQGEMGGLLGLLAPLMGAGMEAMGSNPMLEKMGFSNPFEGIFGNFQSRISDLQEAQQPQLSPYEQRLRVLMDDKGMTRQQAMANQAHAMRLGTDYNRDGAVTNDEWLKYQQSGANNTPAPMHYGSMGGGGRGYGTFGYGGRRR